MWKKKSLLIFIFLLLVPSIYGASCIITNDCTIDEINANTLWAYNPSAVANDDVDSRTAAVNGNTALSDTEKHIGDFSTYVDASADQHLVWTTDARLKTMLNGTIDCWTNATDGSTDPIWFSSFSNGDEDGNWRFDVGSTNTLKFFVQGSGGTADATQLTSPLMDTPSWDHMAGRINRTSGTFYITLFINGTSVGEANTATSSSGPTLDVILGGAVGVAGRRTTGGFDACRIINISLSDKDIKEHLFNGGIGAEYPLQPPDPATKTFQVNATDTYNSSIPLTNITLTVFNSSDQFTFSTVNGTIFISNRTIESFDNLYSMTFGSNDSGGYFNNTISDINISDESSFTGNTFQSVIKVVAVDTLNNNQPINSFSAFLDLTSGSTTNGELLLLVKNGTFNINVTTTGFDKFEGSFSISALQNNTFNASIGSIFTFNLIREETNTPFLVNLTNTTELNIFCPNETIQIIFSDFNQSNTTQIINCPFTLMQMVVDYGALGSYSRTLLPNFAAKTINWYLIDLILGDTAIQRIITLLDLTGEFQNSIMRVKRAITGETILKTIIEQRFDISDQVNLFLVKNGLYILSIENNVEEIVLGNLIPIEAGTQTITLPKLDFVPREVRLGNNITWAYDFNVTGNILRVQYNDETNRTTFVRFTIFNESNNQLFMGESNQNSSVTITFNQIQANRTYSSTLFVRQQDLGNFTDKKIWYEFGGESTEPLSLPGWNPTEQVNIKHWFSWIALAFWGLLFSRRYVGIGMTTMIMWMFVLQSIKWISVPPIIFGFVALIAVVAWLAEAIKKE